MKDKIDLQGYENYLQNKFSGDRGSPVEKKKNSKGFTLVVT